MREPFGGRVYAISMKWVDQLNDYLKNMVDMQQTTSNIIRNQIEISERQLDKSGDQLSINNAKE